MFPLVRQKSSRFSPSNQRRLSRDRSHSRVNDLRLHENRQGSRQRSRERDRDRDRSKISDDRIDRRSRDSHATSRYGHFYHSSSHGYSNDRHRSHRDRSRDKKRSGGDGKGRHEKHDKYKDSLSEGQKRQQSSDSSDVEVDIDINEDDEDEEAIIEKRRKQREDLLKVIIKFYIFVWIYL